MNYNEHKYLKKMIELNECKYVIGILQFNIVMLTEDIMFIWKFTRQSKKESKYSSILVKIKILFIYTARQIFVK